MSSTTSYANSTGKSQTTRRIDVRMLRKLRRRMKYKKNSAAFDIKPAMLGVVAGVVNKKDLLRISSEPLDGKFFDSRETRVRMS